MTAIVHVVDDDPGFRDSLRSLLESDRFLVRTYADAEDFLARYLPGGSGCLLLDVRMPGMSGLQLQEELDRRRIRVPTVFITGHGDVAMAVTAVRRGALDFIEKPFDDEALIAVVRRALEIAAQAQQEQERSRSLEERMASLSAREIEVLGSVVEGRMNKVIAEELGITVKTVEFHRRRIMDKLRTKTTAELIKLVLRTDLTRLRP